MVARLNLWILVVVFVALPVMSADDYELWQKARRHWYKNEWSQAAENYKALIDQYPNSPRRCKSENYLGYCYKNLEKYREAFAIFEANVKRNRCPDETLLDARSEMVRLAYFMVGNGDKGMKRVLIDGTNDDDRSVRFLAALFLAELNDDAGLEVFFEVVEKESDQDLRQSAMRHILKLGNEAQKARLQKLIDEYKEANKGKKAQMVRLVIRDLTSKEPEVRLNVPIGFFNVILASLDDSQLDYIKSETGMDLGGLSTIKLEDMAPGTVLVQIVDPQNKEIKLFLD